MIISEIYEIIENLDKLYWAQSRMASITPWNC